MRGVSRGDAREQGHIGRGVGHTGGGDQDGQQQAEGVAAHVPLAAHDLLARVRAPAPGGDAGGVLDALRIDHAGQWLCVPALLLSYQLPQQADEPGEDAVLLSAGNTAADRGPGREVVRQVAPGEASAVHIQDGIHRRAQVVIGRAADVQAAAAALGPPGRQDQLDQLPAVVGQVTRGRALMTWSYRRCGRAPRRAPTPVAVQPRNRRLGVRQAQAASTSPQTSPPPPPENQPCL